ncbi:cysteine-rich receptor-like protein kinase 11 [Bidens hawaiensis]|uniref:cysteine-rich receptor-like protein kinase 11 n=1 Tax=Bidens hawaiensis TaxID=980011 RepID=UPI004049B27E
METKFLVSLILLLQAIFNNANLVITRQSAICGKDGNFDSDNLLKERDEALVDLDKGFGFPGVYNGIQRGTSNGVVAKSICPLNTKKEDCWECVKKTIPVVKKNCPKQKEGAAWSVTPKLYCVRYANRRFETNLGTEWLWFFPTTTPPAPSTAGELEKGLNNLANKLKEIVNKINNMDRYGSGSISYGPGSRTLYGSMQCYDGISMENCVKCLSEATTTIHDCCSKLRKQSGRAFSIKCAFWYAHDNFLPKHLCHTPVDLTKFIY